MIDKKQYSFFMRYLKEKGLYHAFMRDYRLQQDKRIGGMSLRDYTFGNLHSTVDILMNVICWGEAEYRQWGEEYRRYENFFTENYKEYENKKVD